MRTDLKLQNIKKVDKTEILEIEKITGLKLPTYLIDFLLKYSGGEITSSMNQYSFDYDVLVGDKQFSQSNSIFKILTVVDIKTQWKFIESLYELNEHFELTNEYVEVEKLLPIIDVYGGALYIAISGQHDGKIFYGDNGDFGIIKIADSLNEFFDKKIYTN